MAELPGGITDFGGTGFVGTPLMRGLSQGGAAVRVATPHPQAPERRAESREAILPAWLGQKQR